MLRERFVYSLVEWFEDIGPVVEFTFQHAVNHDHRHLLSMLVRQLSVLENIIQRNTAVLRRESPRIGWMTRLFARVYRGANDDA